MRKYAILMVLMVLIVAAVSGCGLIVKDAEVDAQTVIIEVAGKQFVKAQVQQAIVNVLDYQEYLYSMYGLPYDRTDPEVVAGAQDAAISALVEEAVTAQKMQEYALEQFTQEEMDEINQTIDDNYTAVKDSVKSTYFAETELTGDELDTAIDAKLVEIGYSTREGLLEQQKHSASLDKLRDMVVQDVAVSLDEIQAQYTAGVTNDIETYAELLTQYASNVSSGSIIYFRPPGYRYVKNLLIKISDEDSTSIASLTTQISQAQSTLSATQAAVAELPEDPAEDTEDQQKSREELAGQEAALTAEIDSMTAQLTTLTETAYTAIEATVSEVLAKLDAGEDFDTLVAQYGEDAGMTTEPQKSTGYLICDGMTQYVEEFVTASMALSEVGDISAPFRSSYGFHIVQYSSDLADGQVDIAQISDQIKAEILTSKQDALYDETVNQWIADANAEIYTNRLAD